MRTSASPSVAPRPEAMCSGPVGLEETNSMIVFFLVPPSSWPYVLGLSVIDLRLATSAEQRTTTLTKPGGESVADSTSGTCASAAASDLASAAGGRGARGAGAGGRGGD